MLASFKELLETGSYPVDWPGHWVGGSWRKKEKSGEEKISFNPSRGSKIMTFYCSRENVLEAVEEASTSFAPLQEFDFSDRAKFIKKLAYIFNEYRDLLKICLQVEAGKPAWEAAAEIDAAIQYLKWVAEHSLEIKNSLLAPAYSESSSTKYLLQPIGVTVAYLPFSSPVNSFVLNFTGGILAGCPLIFFSSTQSALSSYLFALLAEQVKMPRGVLNIVFGGFSEFKYSLSDSRVKAIIYTGSKEHCDSLRKGNLGFRNRQMILQSGGKNAALVHSSADLNKAVKSVVYGAFRSAGQLCSSTSRVFVFRSLLPEFREILFQTLSNMKIGPTDELASHDAHGPMMGPLYSKKSVDKFLRFQTMALRDAQENIYLGKEIDVAEQNGYFVQPGVHIIKNFDDSSAYQNNILFTPDLAIYGYDILNEAVDMINKTDSCLSVAYFGDEHILRDRCHLFHSPNLIVNAPTTEIDATLPLAGRSFSGHHRYNGVGLALYLSYPQAFRHNNKDWDLINSWPWP